MKKKNRTVIPSRILPRDSFRTTVGDKRVWIINRKQYASKREYFDSLLVKEEEKTNNGQAEEIEEFEDGKGWQDVSTPVAASE